MFQTSVLWLENMTQMQSTKYIWGQIFSIQWQILYESIIPNTACAKCSITCTFAFVTYILLHPDASLYSEWENDIVSYLFVSWDALLKVFHAITLTFWQHKAIGLRSRALLIMIIWWLLLTTEIQAATILSTSMLNIIVFSPAALQYPPIWDYQLIVFRCSECTSPWGITSLGYTLRHIDGCWVIYMLRTTAETAGRALPEPKYQCNVSQKRSV